MRRTPIRHLAPAACALCLTGVAASAAAQSATPPLALDRFYPAPPGDAMFGVQSPHVEGDLSPQFSVVGDYAHDPLVLQTARTAEARGTVVGAQLLLHLQAGITLRSRLFFHASFPVALLQQGGNPVADGTTFASPLGADIGDLRLGVRLRILGEARDAFQLALGGYAWLPTAKSSAGTYLGEGDVRGLPQILLGGRVAERFVWALDAGLDLRGSRVFGGVNGTSQGTMLRIDGGAGVLLGDARNLQIGLEGSAGFLLANETGTPIERATNLEALLGGKYRFAGDLQIGAGVGPGLTSGLGTPDVRAIGSVAYMPSPRKEAPALDTDGDGVLDAEDACVTVKGLTRSDPKSNGCPDVDRDGIADAEDACPTVKGPSHADLKRNGCPDADSDGDGVTDAEDACPSVKGLAQSDPKNNGCPAPDADGDGLPNGLDACPTNAGPAHADPRRTGCPDGDGDGVPDAQDACPDRKGLEASDAAVSGCPGDRDGDAVADDKDACPEERGDADPEPAKNGCPKSVRVTGTEIVILQEVQFDTSRASIKMVSYPLLDEVAQALRQHPELAKLEVQGHTDDQGKADFNKKLSQDRAESVKKALVQRGIAEARLTPMGYGQDKPIADNKTDKGRQKNRRVQFMILARNPR